MLIIRIYGKGKPVSDLGKAVFNKLKKYIA